MSTVLEAYAIGDSGETGRTILRVLFFCFCTFLGLQLQ